MNVVYFKVDHPPHEKIHPIHFYLKSVKLIRDNEVIADLGDLKITSLPFYSFSIVPTGFGKIEFSLANRSQLRIECSTGYIKTGEYLVATPEGEVIMSFNALSGLWTLNKAEKRVIDIQEFTERHYYLLGPVRNINRGASVY
ncbi:hypothetical protein KXR87_04100 [Yokenella regensburgei]|uniref:hypothetical protein n=1 Tax=Yokenella regensburgei TaxID=158877 RepID=UPI003F16FD7F